MELYNYREVKDVVDLTREKDRQVGKIIKRYEFNEHRIFVINNDFNSWHSIPSEYHRFVFTYNELQFNILDNCMVPKHELTHEVDKNIISQLPIISTHDPVVRRMNFKKDDIIKTPGPYYRVVRSIF